VSDAEPACTFCRIASGALEAARVLAEPSCLAFLDHRPLFHGHVLLVPRAHVETLAELPPDAVAPLFLAARRLSIAVERALDAHGSLLAINNRVSQSVAHLHVHVVPRRRRDGLRGFFWPRTRYASHEEMNAVADRLRIALAELPALR
jgi:histidine triad (HIT) family protein